ncbi:nucleolar transcription factor 1-A [Eurytemora carolleeae]|uniref:nucleolar transcription factor 1-A n=1 Tax=Eurytemora carolleeae TaxID=1294199 RepID=UPI000C762C92|nr:nucleolar transcription factor 1-A [Eurytemora carolleeae]|eukprot:XP_023329465.1 nucleolar transcription factor 1-A-like [Eurytemora affinis]
MRLETDIRMGKKRKVDTGKGSSVVKRKRIVDLNNSDVGLKLESSTEYDDDDPVLLVLPTKDELQVLLDRIEHQLPRDDHVKYDSRARKLDWEQIKFKNHTAEDCKRYWEHIQARIRRFRILSEMIPDARQWLSQPWTNFYKSKDHNRHPEINGY